LLIYPKKGGLSRDPQMKKDGDSRF